MQDEAAYRELVKAQVSYFYGLQRLRTQAAGRIEPKAEGGEAKLLAEHREFFEAQVHDLRLREGRALRRVKKTVEAHPIYPFLEGVKGCGPTMSGVIISMFDIHRAPRPSNFWSFAGLAVRDGKAPRPKKGEKLPYSAWLRAKLVKVLAECLIKANNPVYRAVYDGVKHRRMHQLGPCAACDGKGVVAKKPCGNCDGKGRGPWGRSKGHRHNDAKRQMVKTFLVDLWTEWRAVEGLPVVGPYAADKLGLKHAV